MLETSKTRNQKLINIFDSAREAYGGQLQLYDLQVKQISLEYANQLVLSERQK